MEILNGIQNFVDYKSSSNKSKCAQSDTDFVSAVLKLCSESKKKYWEDEEEKCLIYQWLEFASIHSCQMKCDPQHWKVVSNELNHFLESRSYLNGCSKTLADVIIYNLLFDTFERFSLTQKEQYKNLSRWFDHIQQDEKVRNENKLINFSTLYISSRVTARH